MRRKLPCKREKATKIIDILIQEKKDSIKIDGIKYKLSGHAWVLIRPSGTENSLRISAESDSLNYTEKIMAEYMKKLQQLMLEA